MQLPIRSVTRPTVLSGRSNGKLPSSILVTTPGEAGGPDVVLVEVAARAWRALVAAAKAAGHILKATSLYDSYRPYEVQERIFRERYTTSYLAGRPSRVWQGKRWYQRPNTAAAAVPGTSNHGWGLAVDIGEERDGDAGTESIGTDAVRWLVSNALAFGFSAELQSEPWHWRYYAGDSLPAAVRNYEAGNPYVPAPAPADWREEIVRSMKVLNLSKVTKSSDTWIRGEDVATLQGALLARGHGPAGLVGKSGRPDGIAGPATRRELGEFQQKHKTGKPSSPGTADYIAGEATWRELLNV